MTKKTKAAEAPEAQEGPVETGEVHTHTRADVVSLVFDNENEVGCLCTMTFSDGVVAIGSAVRTDDLAADQRLAIAAALASVV